VQAAVNVSIVQVMRNDFFESVLDVLKRTGLDASLLQLELTESGSRPGRSLDLAQHRLFGDIHGGPTQVRFTLQHSPACSKPSHSAGALPFHVGIFVQSMRAGAKIDHRAPRKRRDVAV
jgi:hypothetical protein